MTHDDALLHLRAYRRVKADLPAAEKVHVAAVAEHLAHSSDAEQAALLECLHEALWHACDMDATKYRTQLMWASGRLSVAARRMLALLAGLDDFEVKEGTS